LSSDNLSAYLQQSRRSLIESLRQEGILKSREVEEALSFVPREAFLDQGSQSLAYLDEPLPIASTGQTISAPHMVAIMLEELELQPEMKVLEIGTGSGYNAALLGHIVSRGLSRSGNEPLVTSIERDEKLTSFAMQNIEKVGLSNIVRIVAGDGSLGYPQESNEELYDRITITAGAPRVPHFLKSQLKNNGILLAPIGGRSYQQLIKLRKRVGRDGKSEFTEEKLVDCMFVPLIGSDAHSP